MKVWYFIRRPIGVILMAGVLFLTLAILHAIPELLLALMTGRI